MTADKKPPAPDGSPQEVERIRDIIFGPQMRTYEGQFEAILCDLDRLRQEIAQLDSRIVEQDRKMQANYRESHKALEALRDELHQELRRSVQTLMSEKVDREMLADMFIEMGGLLKSGGSLADSLKALTKSSKEK